MLTRHGKRHTGGQGVVVKGVVVLGVAGLTVALAGSAEAQVSGRVVYADGPIGLSIVFGDRPAAATVPARVVHYAPRPAIYRRGMTLRHLDLYLARIEHEYDFYRKMHPHEARRLGWSMPELRAYVRWLRDERRWLREERRRFERGYYGWERDWDRDQGRDRPGRGRGGGRGGGR
jgi:hypothetical protein